MADSEHDCSSRSSSRGSSFSLCVMTESAYAKVVFCEIHDSYSTDADVECLYQLSESVVPHPDDSIGLFRVGWQSLNECITSIPCASATQNASVAGDSYHKIVFKSEDLPKDDLEYYQFLYLTGSQEICGASTPFKFHTVHEDENIVVLSAEHDFLEVKSSTSLLHHRLAETQKHVASLEKAKKDLEDKILKIESENKTKIENILMNHEENDSLLEVNLRSIFVGGTEPLPFLYGCSENVRRLLYDIKKKTDFIFAENSSVRKKNSMLQNNLAKVQGDFKSYKSEVQTSLENITSADCTKSSVQLLRSENIDLKEEKCSLQKALGDTTDLFRASEQCKSLVLQELESVKKSKDEMSASMEDLKLLNSLLKKQLANNENAIKEMEKVWRELEDVKTNFDSEKESWEKQRNKLEERLQDLEKQRSELEEQVHDFTVRLKEAAELYKKQFLEIRSLKKNLKSHESAKRKLSNDEVISLSGDNVRYSSSEGTPSLEGAQTPSFMTQSLAASLSDSFSLEHVAKPEKVQQLAAVPDSAPVNLKLNYITWSTCSSSTELTVGKPSAPAEEEIRLPEVEASAAVNKVIVVDGAASSEIECTRSETYNSSQAMSTDNSLHQEQGATDAHIALEEISSLYQLSPEMFDLPCPLCDELITVYGNNTTKMNEHLFDVHRQQLCPVCGCMFDNGLPSNYFKYHVENHFTGTQSPQ